MQGHDLVLAYREQLVGDRIESIECFVHRIEVCLPAAGQGQSAVVPYKQWRVQVILELPDLLADRGL
jgi:hypothetical protein